MQQFLTATVFPVLMIIAGASDLISLRIPNKLTAFIALAALPAAFVAGMPMVELLMHIAAGAALFLLGYGLFSFRLVGGGDAKLMAAAAIWFGWAGLYQFFMATAMAGGVLALSLLAWSYIRIHAEARNLPLLKRFGMARPPIPYGFAFAIGAIGAYPESWWMRVAQTQL